MTLSTSTARMKLHKKKHTSEAAEKRKEGTKWNENIRHAHSTWGTRSTDKRVWEVNKWHLHQSEIDYLSSLIVILFLSISYLIQVFFLSLFFKCTVYMQRSKTTANALFFPLPLPLWAQKSNKSRCKNWEEKEVDCKFWSEGFSVWVRKKRRGNSSTKKCCYDACTLKVWEIVWNGNIK